jgi:arylsulfatase A-like enzyme
MKNIILITVDGLRYDHSKIVKNKMDEILGEGIDFENAYSTGPSTSMSYIGLLCSKFPTFPNEINSITKMSVDRKRTLLYEVLKNNGFNTYVISNCLFNRYYGYDKGVDLLIDKKLNITRNILKKAISYINSEKELPYFDAQEITEIVKNIFNDQINDNNKIFMHINYMDTHTPPNISNNYIRKNFSKEEIHNNNLGIEEICAIREALDKAEQDGKVDKEANKKLNIYQNLYYNEVLYVADHISNLLKYFKKTLNLKDTLFIMHSDHGEYLWPEGKLLGHGLPIGNKEEAINVFFENLIHVPLSIWGLDQNKVEKVVSLVDLAPTILEIIGLEKPPEWYGNSLFDDDDEKPAISEDIRHGCKCYSVRTNEWIYKYNEETKQECLLKNQYPYEKTDLSSDNPKVVIQMLNLLEIHNNKKNVCYKEYLKKDINDILIGVN